MRSPATPVPYSFQQRQRAKTFGIEGALRHVSLPGVPVQRRGGEVGRRRIDPRPVRIVAAQRAFHELKSPSTPCATSSRAFAQRTELDALRSDLHDPPALLRGRHHRAAIRHAVRHRLLAVDVLPGAHGVHDDLPMPVIGHRGDDAVDLLVVEQLLVPARRPQVGADDFTRARVPPVVEVARGDAFDTGQADRPCEQAGSLHPDPDYPEAHAVAGGHLTRGSAERTPIRVGWRSRRRRHRRRRRWPEGIDGATSGCSWSLPDMTTVLRCYCPYYSSLTFSIQSTVLPSSRS